MLQDKRRMQQRRLQLEAIYAAAVLSCVVFGSTSAWAQDATWDGDSGNNWNNSANWNPNAVPSDEAFFNAEGNDQPTPTLNGNANINSILFQDGANTYTVTTNGFRLSVNGSGITNNSGAFQRFSNSTISSTLRFQNSATIDGGANGVQITNTNGGLTLFLNNSSAGNVDILNNAFSITRFRDNSSAGNATITNDGFNALTNFVDNSRSANATISNQNGARTRYEGTAYAVGTTITNNNNGTTRFEGSSQAYGGTQITNNNGGLTVFEDNAIVGAATIINNSGGRTRFDENAGGSANTTLVNNAGGALDVSGLNISATIGSVSGAGDIYLGARTLAVGAQNNNETISGVIQDGGVFGGTGGNLVKQGTGTLRLTGNNTYTGTTSINSGTLQVDGSITSNTTVASTGRLTGSGEVTGNLTNNGGRIAAGRGSDAVGGSDLYADLDVNGNVDINGDSSRLDIRVNAPVAPGSFGAVNRLNATGTVDLDGQVTVNTAGQSAGQEYLLDNRYRIISSNIGLTGTFDGIDFANSNIESFLDASLGYDANNAFLNLRRNTLLDQEEDFTKNQQALFDEYNAAIEAGAVIGTDNENLINSFIINGAGALDLANGDALTAFPVASQAAASRFNQRLMTQDLQQSNESNAQTARRSRSRLVYAGKRNLLAQAEEGTATGAAASEYSHRSSIWATIARAKDNGDSDGNGPGFDSNATEYQLGFNRNLSDNTVVGLSIGKSDADVDINERDAEGDVDTNSIGAFLRHDSGDWYLSGLLSYSRHDIDSERETGIGTATANFDARTLALWGEVGKKLTRGGWNIEPNVSLKFSNTKQDDFTEDGPGGLTVDSSSYNSRRLGLGVRITSNDETARFRPHFSLGYEREFGDNNVRLSNSLPFLGTFDVDGSELGKNIWTARLGADARLNDRFSLTGEIGGSWRSNQDSHYIYGGVKYGW